MQAVEVHVDVLAQGLERLGLGPVAGELARHHGAHHRTRRIHLAHARQVVAVVPGLALVQVAAPLLAQCGDLVGGEAHIGCHLERIDHAELVKHVERRVAAVFFDGQDTRHVRECDKRLVFEPGTQEVEVGLLRVVVFGALAHDAVPLVDDDDELAAGLGVDVAHRLGQESWVEKHRVRIRHLKLAADQGVDACDKFINAACRAPKLLHVELEHVVAVALSVKRWVACNGEPGKLGRAVYRAVVVGAHHIGGHGRAEAPRAAHAHIEVLGVHDGVEMRDEHALVHIGIRVAPTPQHSRPRVEKHAHTAPPSVAQFICLAIIPRSAAHTCLCAQSHRAGYKRACIFGLPLEGRAAELGCLVLLQDLDVLDGAVGIGDAHDDLVADAAQLAGAVKVGDELAVDAEHLVLSRGA